MGGGSAQVNPPYQVSVAEGLTALLGDQVTVVDGVEVRTRPVPARGGFLTDPVTGEPGVRVTLLDADGAELEQRHRRAAPRPWSGWTTTSPAPSPPSGSRAAVTGAGPVELGVHRRRRLGGPASASTSLRTQLRVSGSGIGEEILAPPAATAVLDGAGRDGLSRRPSRCAAAPGRSAASAGSA